MDAIRQRSTTLAPEEELLSLLRDSILPEWRRTWPDHHAWGALLDFQRRLASRGWTAPGWPLEIGGRGLDVESQIACERVMREAGAPRRVAVFGVNNVGPTIAAVGTDDQKRHLRAIASADEVWCQGFSEPDAGSDLAGLRTRAELVGDHFVINGQKIWTSIGLHATHCMLLARTDPTAAKHRGISALLVPLDSPGVTRRPITQINGRQEFAEMFFDDVRVPASALLGPLNEGWRVTMTTLGYERAGVISMAGDLAAEAEETIHRLADAGRLRGARLDRAMALLIEARLLRVTGERALKSEAAGPGALSSLIKLGWSQVGSRLARFATDAEGLEAVIGHGRAGTALLESCSYTIAGGTTEVLKGIIAERALALPR